MYLYTHTWAAGATAARHCHAVYQQRERANPNIPVRFHIIGNARIKNVGKYQSCMVSKLPSIWMETDRTSDSTSWGLLTISWITITHDNDMAARSVVCSQGISVRHRECNSCLSQRMVPDGIVAMSELLVIVLRTSIT